MPLTSSVAPAGVLGAQVADRVDRGVDRVDGHGVGQRRRARRRSPPRSPGRPRAARRPSPTSPGWPSAASSAPTPSLRVRLSSRVSARDSSAVALALGGAELLLQRGEPLGRASRGPRRRPRARRPAPPRPPRRPRPATRAPRTAWSPPGHAARRRPATRAGGRSRPAVASTRLRRAATWPGEPGDALAAVGGTAQRGARPPSRRPSPRPRPPARAVTAASRAARDELDLAGQLGLRGAHALGLGGQVVRVRAAGALRPGAAEQPDPVGGERRGAAQPLAQRREPVPDLAGLAQRGCGLGGLALERGQARARRGQRRPRPPRDGRAARSRRRSPARAWRSAARGRRRAARARASRRSAWTDCGLARDLRLPAERAELASDLARQVTQRASGWPASPRACGAPSPCACGA